MTGFSELFEITVLQEKKTENPEKTIDNDRLLLYNKKVVWGRSSLGRALEWHSRGKGFDPPRLHQMNSR